MPEAPNPKLRPSSIEAPEETFKPSDVPYAELEVTTNFSFLRGASHPDELVAQAARLGYRAIAVTDHNSLAGAVRMHDAVEQIRKKNGWAPRLLVGARLTFVDGSPDVLVWVTDRAAYGRLCRMLTEGKRRAPKGECHLTLEDLLKHQEGLLAAVVPGERLEVRGQRSGGNPKSEISNSRSQVGNHAGFGASSDDPDRLRIPNSKSQISNLKSRHLRFDSDVTIRISDFRRAENPTRRAIRLLGGAMADRLSIATSCVYGPDDASRLRQLIRLSRATGVPLLATNDVHYHHPARRPLQDILTCVRHGCTIHDAGFKLFPNGERYLKSSEQMHRLFADHPQAVRRGIDIAERCTFQLSELQYEYPDEVVPAGKTVAQHLADLTWAGAKDRYPDGVPEKVTSLIHKELAVISQQKWEAYFLTVHDVVHWARDKDILCQGRGSAANSAVCFCLGITSVDPNLIDVLFERFISAARGEPPDIDVDFEHERREEVIQYLYNKYGRERAGMTATLITYRGRSAVRDVGKALGLGLDMVDQMAKRLDWWDRGTLSETKLREVGLDPADRTVMQVVALTGELLGFPRHLSQHVGGMVMTRGPLCEMVPIENASMADRTVIEWDKDDIDTLGILKIDALALGMLTCISKAFRLIDGTKCRHEGTKARRHEGKGEYGEGHSDVSGSGGLAVGHGVGKGGLSGDAADAEDGDVRADQSNATGDGIYPVEHRRGIRPPEHGGLPEVPADRPRVALGVGHPMGTGHQSGNDGRQSQGDEVDRRGGPCPPRAHPKPERPDLTNDSPSSPSCLRAFVPSCLHFPSRPLELHTVPPEDPATYDMICDADTIGVFQIESRAQMTMLPRLKPKSFYDLVIEVAIVRPGPIQGDMVHPYLRRRNKEEEVTYPKEELRTVLEKTLGVPLFQEQAMRIAMVGAGFSGEEADRLRRAMAAWRKQGELDQFHERLVRGMIGNGYTPQFAEQCWLQIKGFGEYGFPESHAASFAKLVYVSAWIKRHHPAAFCAALLNSQPMGFYAPAQIVRDAREHGVEVRPADVNEAGWDCGLEEGKERQARRHEGTKARSDIQNAEGTSDSLSSPSCLRAFVPSCLHSSSPPLPKSTWGHNGPSVRLGFRVIKGFRQDHADAIVAARQRVKRFTSIERFHRATALPRHAMQRLAEADAFTSLGLSRRQALWKVLAIRDEEMPLFALAEEEHGLISHATAIEPALPVMPIDQEVMADYRTTSLSLKRHPVSLVRQTLDAMEIIQATELSDGDRMPHGKWVRVAGLVLIRQRPGTASGIVFETIEDETGVANLIIRPHLYERYRAAARYAALLRADGLVERQGQVVHVMVRKLIDLSHLLPGYLHESRDFH